MRVRVTNGFTGLGLTLLGWAHINIPSYRRDNIKTVAPAVRQNATSSAATGSEKNPIWFTLVALQDQ